MALIVTGYVNGEPVYYEEQEPTLYEATAESSESGSYEVEITAEDEYGNTTTVSSFNYVEGTWIEPIVDRVAQDLVELNSKAYLSYWDLNRVEIDTEYLSLWLTQCGYFQIIDCYTLWSMFDYPTTIQMERVRANVLVLMRAFYFQDVPFPTTLQYMSWVTLNNLEDTLKHMKEMIERMLCSYRYSGNLSCGQGVVF